MATIICQGMQSCTHESQLVESRKPLRIKLSSPIKPQIITSQSIELSLKQPNSCLLDSNNNTKTTKDYNNSSCYSFLQALSNNTKQTLTEENQNTPYVHPLLKTSFMSEKSLELCTESLGSETGSHDIIDTIINNNTTREQHSNNKKSCLGTKKVKRSQFNAYNFPPPLTTMRASESLQVRTQREDGRLIMKAVKIPSRNNYFLAERSHGRLRLCFVKVCDDPNFDSLCEENNIEENDGGEKEMEEINQRTRRCKESGLEKKKGLLNYEAFWVAT